MNYYDNITFVWHNNLTDEMFILDKKEIQVNLSAIDNIFIGTNFEVKFMEFCADNNSANNKIEINLFDKIAFKIYKISVTGMYNN